MKKPHKIIMPSLGAITMAMLSQPAFAQDAAPAPAAQAEQDDGALGEIVVTAQRREQRLQDVPVAITALTSSDLQNQGLSQTFDLPAAVPGLLFSKATNSVQLHLRGVGTQSITPGNDPSVAMYVDGVYNSAPPGMLFSFNSVERIEVLRGPQGTLFGRNATGGLINIVTRDPGAETEANINLGYGSFNAFSSSAYISGGSDVVAADLSLIFNKQSDGWGRNVFTPSMTGPITVGGVAVTSPAVDADVGTLTEYGARSKIVIRPDANTTIKLSGTYINNQSDQNLYRSTIPGSIASATGVTPYFNTESFYDINADTPWLATNEQYMGAVEISYTGNFATLRSISSYLDSFTVTKFDLDASPQVSGTQPLISSRFRTFTQELQILSNPDNTPDWLEYTGGLYFLHSRAAFDPIHFLRGNGLDTVFDRYSSQETTSYAAYGQATFSLTPTTRLTLGGRLTHDTVIGQQYFVGTNAFATTGSSVRGQVSSLVTPQTANYSAFTWRVALDQYVTPDVLVYASVNRGFKAGAWNQGALCVDVPAVPVGQACRAIQPAARPETLTSYDFGIKSDWLNNHLRVNLSVFYYDYKDLQVQAIVGVPPVSILTNAASAELYGGELEIVARVTPNFTLNFSGALLHSEYTSFPGAPTFVPRTAAPYGNATVTANVSGNELVKAPNFTSSVSANWRLPTSFGDFNLSGTWSHNDGFFWDVSNRVKAPAYDLVNGSISFTLPDEHWRVRLWGNNLLGTQYYSFVNVSGSGDQGAPGAPRTYGVTLGWSY